MSTLAQIETLKQQLEQVSADLTEAKHRSWEAKKTLLGAKLRAWYFRTALALRKPAGQYSMWSTGVLIVGPIIASILAFIVLSILGIPGGLIFWLVLLTAVVAGGGLSVILSYPTSAVLPKLIADERFLANEYRDKASQLTLEVSTLQKHLVATKAAIQELLDEDRRKRELLLKRNWKVMRDGEWRAFVGEVFESLGAEVQKLDATEDNAADFIVTYGDLTIAVSARGSVVAVTNKDVQAVEAARRHHQSDRATVITNSRLAHSAIEEAEGTGCILVGMKEFQSFVMGSNLELFR